MKIDVFSYANNRISLFIQVLFNRDEKKQKVSFRLVERDKENKQVRAEEYYFDMNMAHVIMEDLKAPTKEKFHPLEEIEEFKKSGKGDRAIKISPKGSLTKIESYTISIMNELDGEEKDHLYIKLPRWEMKALANRVWWGVTVYRVIQMVARFIPFLRFA